MLINNACDPGQFSTVSPPLSFLLKQRCKIFLFPFHRNIFAVLTMLIMVHGRTCAMLYYVTKLVDLTCFNYTTFQCTLIIKIGVLTLFLQLYLLFRKGKNKSQTTCTKFLFPHLFGSNLLAYLLKIRVESTNWLMFPTIRHVHQIQYICSSCSKFWQLVVTPIFKIYQF